MRGFYFIPVLMLINCLKEIHSLRVSTEEDDQKITYVKIKPIIIERRSNHAIRNLDSYRSSRIENIPLLIRGSSAELAPIPNVRTSRNAQSTESILRSTDYIDRDNESEARFDTSEAIVSDDDSESLQIGASQRNDLLNTYRPSSKNTFKLKAHLIKKYYGDNSNPSYRKYLETRQFRSRCRCERIWNCPKLQISVPRCPEEYFLCCF